MSGRGGRVCSAVLAVLAASAAPLAQTRPGDVVPGQATATTSAAAAAGRGTARAAAPVDLTGQWVSVVTEDWRWRMMTPPKGDIQSIPLNAEGRRIAEAWDPSTEGSCLGYGAPALLRVPGRIRISWEDEQTLRIETDAGRQTRRLHFAPARRPPAPSLQGYSVAEWERAAAGPGGFDGLGRGGGNAPPPRWLPLKVVTTNLRAGWLRPNGVPYSASTRVTERFVRYSVPHSGEWLTVMAIVEDPVYLTQPFITSANFRREADETGWSPASCR